MDNKDQVLVVAKEILDNKISILEGARKLSKFQFVEGFKENKDIMFFVFLDSESDNLPIGEERKNWDPTVLAEKDKDIKDIENYYKNDAIAACQHLMAKS